MENLVDDFNELEIEEWASQSDPFGRIVSEVARGVISHSKSSLLARTTFADYQSFLSYLQEYEIAMIPEEQIVRGEKLGSGATMTVYEAKCPSVWADTDIAIKALNVNLPFTKPIASSNTRDLRRQIAAAALELRVLSDTNLRQHPNIINLLGASWETVTSQSFDEKQPISSIRPLLIVERADPTFPTMRDYVDHCVQNQASIPFETKHSLLSDVADALADLHACSVVHGDIKPENILLFRDHNSQSLVAKLSDFGGCYLPIIQADGTIVEELDEPKIMGTTYWNAPECLESPGKVEPGRRERFARDYYCMGLLIYYVLFEELPFGTDEALNAGHITSINAIKNDEHAVLSMVTKKMTSWWKLGFQLEALKELSDETNFVKRHAIFERHFKIRKVSISYT
jgi:serine/threonine protein kinase